MRNLPIAQTTRFAAAVGSSVRALVGNEGMIFGDAPASQQHPFVEMQYDLGGSTEETLGKGTATGSRIDTVNMEFVVHSLSQSPDQAFLIGEALMRLYDNAFFALSSSQTVVDVKRQSGGVPLQVEGDDAWQYSIPYMYQFG